MKKSLVLSLLTLFVLAVAGGSIVFAQNQTNKGNQIDLQFLDMMMMHHQDGVKMTSMAVDKAQNAGVKALAQKMAADQQKDTTEMQSMRERHFANEPKAESMTVKGQAMTMQEMMQMSQSDKQKLEAATGAEFDRTFLDTFIRHHQMAIDMSQEEVSTGSDAEIKKKAREIITKQTEEIGEMKRLKTKVAGGKTAKKTMAKKARS